MFFSDVLGGARVSLNFLTLCLYFFVRLKEEKWMNVQVGDIIKLSNNEFVTVSMEMLQ